MSGKTVFGWLLVCGMVVGAGCSCRSVPQAPEQLKVDYEFIRQEEGRDAARNGIPANACPYPTNGFKRIDWLRGWIEETKKINAAKREGK